MIVFTIFVVLFRKFIYRLLIAILVNISIIFLPLYRKYTKFVRDRGCPIFILAPLVYRCEKHVLGLLS